jgi:hypothetical protein
MPELYLAKKLVRKGGVLNEDQDKKLIWVKYLATEQNHAKSLPYRSGLQFRCRRAYPPLDSLRKSTFRLDEIVDKHDRVNPVHPALH